MVYLDLLQKKAPYSLNEIRFLQVNFNTEINKLLSRNSTDDICCLVENYINQFPHARHKARQIAYVFRDQLGLSTAYERLIKAFIDVTNKVSAIGKKIYNLPAVFENLYSMERIGEIVFQTALAHYSLQLGLLETKPILMLPDENPVYKIANKGFLPYLKDSFEIVSTTEEVKSFDRMLPIIPYFGQLMKVTEEIYGGDTQVIPVCYNLLKKSGKRPFAFEILEQTEEIATKFLSAHGLNLKKPFVTLHLREPGYVDSALHEWRNINVETYKPAISWLLRQGIQIVRIGHPKMTPIEGETGLIDLTSIKRPGEVDIYLCAKNLFFYGTDSGPCALAYQFGTPVLISSTVGCTVRYQNSLIQFQKMKWSESGRPLRFSDIIMSELRQVVSPTVFKRAGIEMQLISPSEHLKSVKEMIEFLEGGKIIKTNQEYNNRKVRSNIKEYTYLTSDTLDLL